METLPQSHRRWRSFEFGPASAVVLAHFIITLVHGIAHAELRVELSRWSALFVAGVVVIGPIAGLGICWSGRRISGWAIVAATMTSAFVFGVWNHFVSPGADHVAHLPSVAWKLPFQFTAWLLAATEAGAAVLGFVRWSAERKTRLRAQAKASPAQV